MRLFVDIDDTLILYDLEANTPFTINEKLLEGIKQFQQNNPDELIVVWSGGGKEYARMWGDKLGLEGITYLLKDKDSFWLVNSGDIVIDDQPMSIRTHAPNEWP